MGRAPWCGPVFHSALPKNHHYQRRPAPNDSHKQGWRILPRAQMRSRNWPASLPGLADLSFLSFSLIFVLFIECAVPLVHLALSVIFRDPVAFLDPANQLIALSRDYVQIVIGQLAPAGLNRALHLFPLAFHLVPVHTLLL